MLQIQIDTPIMMLLFTLAFLFLPQIQLIFIFTIAFLVDLYFYMLRKLMTFVDKLFELIVYLFNNKSVILFTTFYILYFYFTSQ